MAMTTISFKTNKPDSATDWSNCVLSFSRYFFSSKLETKLNNKQLYKLCIYWVWFNCANNLENNYISNRYKKGSHSTSFEMFILLFWVWDFVRCFHWNDLFGDFQVVQPMTDFVRMWCGNVSLQTAATLLSSHG